CMASRVQAEYPDALTVHRLDMATSGVLLMAKNTDIHRYLSGLFQEREVEKRYVAIVDGQVRQAIGKIELPLITDWPNRPRQIVDHENGKPSLTRFKVLWRNIEENTTRIELAPVTGRSHQLRVHMHSLGHAILGDRLYANDEVLQRSERLMLHAQSLSLIHPLTKEPMRFISEAPF
ncbi:MAG: RluA family pseudouridine synthase, partial [Gammaproteobacteria bacterium]|nr:RluA family pseudouridine synthase [Gammaproteobacteria bacterium]